MQVARDLVSMKSKEIRLRYTEYAVGEALPEADAELVRAAALAREQAYAPYSSYKVGAALRLEDGTVVVGNNQENAAYPSGLCAERVALFAARAQFSDKRIVVLAVITESHENQFPASPCGSCRQVMIEFEQLQGQPIRLIMANTAGAALVFDQLADLLPLCFTNHQLKGV